MTMGDKVIVVAGPTASGKTALGIDLARRLGGEIVSADSMQVYKYMDIGTAKASPRERAQAVHHMLDVALPWEDYSVALYVQQAESCCRDILRRGKIPIIVGGTGLYIDSLLAGRDFQAGSDPELRAALEREYESLGPQEMWQRLNEIDPQRAEKLSPTDRRRIVRALEVYAVTGRTITDLDRESRERPPRFQAAYICLGFQDRQDLYSRIDRRAELMEEQGLFSEVQGLLDMGLSLESTAMQAIGYKEPAQALLGMIDRREAMEQIKQNSRRYAKRQLTWFRRRQDALWINWPKEPDLDLGRQLSAEFLHSHGIS